MTPLKMSTNEFLFINYSSPIVKLMTIVLDYYPYLSKALRKANNQESPFSVFKIDKSKRAPF